MTPPAENVQDAGIEVIELSGPEYRAAVRKALRSLGLSYNELRDQARRREFSSPQAQMLWVAIGGKAS
jgi:hypothetical protein